MYGDRGWKIGIEALVSNRRWLRDRHGGTAVEYALVLSVIAVMVLAGLQDLGSAVVDLYRQINEALESVSLRLR